MKKRQNPLNKTVVKEKFLGWILLHISLLLAASFSFGSRHLCGIFSRSSCENIQTPVIISSYISDLFFQTFGLFSYAIVLLLFIWGVNTISGKIHYIKRRGPILLSYIFLGCIVLNVASSNSIGANIIQKLNINYYAGGFIGYLLSKHIFIKSAQYFWLYMYIVIFIIWIFVAKKALFINFDSMKEHAPKIFAVAKDMVKPNKPKKMASTPIWTETPILPEAPEDLRETEVFEEAKTEEVFYMNDDAELSYESEDISGLVIGGGGYALPSIELLEKHVQKSNFIDDQRIAELSAELCGILEEFGVKGDILNVRQGPVVTMFEFRPAPGIKTSRVISLSDDIARSMSAISARISTIPGQNAIGIEIPNKTRQTVFLRDLLSSDAFLNFSSGIPLILGKDINGTPIATDLAKMPHLLVAGTTGSGKSVSINCMILSILFKFSPNDCKLIMIDPKMLELSVYDEIPHLLTPVVTDPKKAVFALKWAVSEMESRYRQMSKLGVRNIDGFNKKLKESKEKGEFLVRKVQTGFDQETGRPIFETQQLEFEPMPYIVIIVDEMADLMLVAGKDVEAAIQRLAQMARAAGIHLIMATQRPSVDVITGTIKANFPTRVSFQVTSKIDSRTILGEQGAEQLLGQGDMLYMPGAGRIMRVHGPFVKDIEVEKIVSYIRGQKEPTYVDVITESFNEDEQMFLDGSDGAGVADEMYERALEIIINDRRVSISYLQRKLQIGYNRAARIIEELEERGVISPPSHTGKREILI